MRRRKQKKVPFGDRRPLQRPLVAREVWSTDFALYRTAEGCVLERLTVGDDATHEAAFVEVERAISGHGVDRVLDRLTLSRGLSQIARGNNGKDLCSRLMLEWAHRSGVQLRSIEPGGPSKSVYIIKLNGQLGEDCLNEHWFPILLQARSVIER